MTNNGKNIIINKLELPSYIEVNMMKKLFIILLFVISFLFMPNVYARSGCCSWHGGVSGSCRNGKQVCNDGSTSPSCTCEDTSSNTENRTYVNYVYGCTDSNATNYNSNANKDDGSCITKIYGCLDQNASNYKQDANTADGSCQYEEIKTIYKKIKYKTKKKYKLSVKEGKVIKKGKKGTKKLTIKIIKNEQNEEVDRETISEEIIKKPINKIVTTKKKNN